MKPLCIDLFCGLGGWTEGFLAEGYDVVGFDIKRHVYGEQRYPAQLVLQDVTTLHGSQFRDATAIVASPPCQKYSYLAMPWSRSKSEHSKAAKALRKDWETNGPDNRLFDACFRIQREACEASGRRIPLIVENVRGAVPWVTHPPRWAYGSFYLWGDVPALMPVGGKRKGLKVQATRGATVPPGTGKSSWFFGNTKHEHRTDPRDIRRDENGDWRSLDGTLIAEGLKRPGQHISQGFNNWPKDEEGRYVIPDGTKIGGDWFSDPNSTCRKHGSRSAAREAASAQIAKIPFPLAVHIARCFKD